jgi:hypothetical protein
MNIDQIKQGMEIAKLLTGDDSCVTTFPEPVGQNIFVRTVTMYYLGCVDKVCGQWLTLKDASWVADTGRFGDFLKEGKGHEIEPFQKNVHIPLGSIIDVTKFDHALPREQK